MSKQKHTETPKQAAPVPATLDNTEGAVLDPAAIMDYSNDIGAGFEGADAECFAVPRLKTLQKMTPAVDPNDGAYVEGAVPGKFLNNITNEVYDSVLFIPCAFKRSFLQWATREAGGGFEGEHMPDAAIVHTTIRNDKGQDMLPTGASYLQDTRTHLGLVVKDDGTYTPVALALSSTQMKKSKQWMSIMQNIKVKTPKGIVTPPMFSHMYKLTTVPEKNDKGSWYGLKVEIGGPTPPELYQAARAFHQSIRAGAVKVQHENDDVTSGTDPEGYSEDRF